jgi:hypothetical protein
MPGCAGCGGIWRVCVMYLCGRICGVGERHQRERTDVWGDGGYSSSEDADDVR